MVCVFITLNDPLVVCCIAWFLVAFAMVARRLLVTPLRVLLVARRVCNGCSWRCYGCT